MDHSHFDELARSLGGEGGTRRALLRLLAGGTLATIARFGLAAVTAARPHRKNNGKGKGKDKDKGKNKRKNHDKKPCGDACITSGGHCCGNNTCAHPGSCCPDEKPCGDICVRKKDCCMETHRPCPDGSCVAKDRCCKGERRCANGSCQLDRPHFCCPEEEECDDGACVKPGQCCPGEFRCANGSCIPESECCPEERRCDSGDCVNRALCCPDEQQCEDLTCVKQDECCPDAVPPICEDCEEEACVNGHLVCRPRDKLECPPGSVDCGSCIRCCPTADPNYGFCDAQGRCCIFNPYYGWFVCE
jgi:hypothetical protein